MQKALYLTLLLLGVINPIYSQIIFSQSYFKKPDEAIVYIGIPNYFLMKVPQDEKVIYISSSEGTIERLSDTSFNFYIQNASVSGITFTYNISKRGKIQKKIRKKVVYLTAIVPEVAKLRLGTKTSNKISLSELKLISKLTLNDKDFLLKLNYKINCNVVCKPIKAVEKYNIAIRNSDLSGNIEFQELLQKLTKGDRIKFENIKVLSDDGKIKKLEPVVFTID